MKTLTGTQSAFAFKKPKPKLAVLPVGATEQHSRHLPLLTDTIVADALSARVLEQVDYAGTAYLLPTLPISSSELKKSSGVTAGSTRK